MGAEKVKARSSSVLFLSRLRERVADVFLPAPDLPMTSGLWILDNSLVLSLA